MSPEQSCVTCRARACGKTVLHMAVAMSVLGLVAFGIVWHDTLNMKTLRSVWSSLGCLIRARRSLPIAPDVQAHKIAAPFQIDRNLSAQRMYLYAHVLDQRWDLCIRSSKFFLELQKAQEKQHQHDLAAFTRLFGAWAFYPVDGRDSAGVSTWGLPLLSKTPPVLDNRYVIMPFRTYVHWKEISQVDKCDIPYKQKEPVLMWRGRLSGNPNKPFGGHRHKLLAKYFDHNSSLIDIGPSRIDYNALTKGYLFRRVSQSRLEAFASRESMTPCSWMKYRYLLSVEGNDVATALTWMLYSTSVVFMPLPTVTSWAAEPLMIPWKEYVPVSHSFDDLLSKVQYCNGEGFERCYSIALNGREYAKQFFNRSQEIRFVHDIMEAYAKQVSFYVTPKALEYGLAKNLITGWESNLIKLCNSSCPNASLMV